MDSVSVGRAIQSVVDDEELDLLGAGLAEQEGAERILRELAQSSDLEIRGAVPRVAAAALRERAIPLLLELSDDPDADIRGIALDELGRLDPEAIRALLPKIRRRINSTSDHEAISNAWRAAILHDPESIDAIAAFMERFQASQWQYKGADVILTFMTDPDSVLSRIRMHDHEHMGWLAHAASLMNTEASRTVLEEFALTAPDDRCRSLLAREGA